MSAPAPPARRTRAPQKAERTSPARRPVDPRVRERWIAARREEGRRRLRILVVIASVLGVLLVAGGVTLSPLLRIEEIKVSGTNHVTPDAVLRAGGVGEGDAMVWLDPGALERRIEASPWIRTAAVQRDWPRTLVVNVTERKPVAWAARDGGAVLVDRTGRVLAAQPAPPAGLPELVDLALVPRPGGTVSPSDGARLAAAYGDWAGGVRSVSVRDGTLVATLAAGPEVRFGVPAAMQTKLRASGAVLAFLGGALPAYIDVSVPTNPVTG